jgi:CubicO group peptidase (beta-lactamase class C family)
LRTKRFRQLAVLASLSLLCGGMRATDELDTVVESEMAKREVVGLSLAVIDNGRIVETRAYGTTTRGGSVRVTPATLFQAGSISKPVAAAGALQLVERGKLSLDEDVNTKLRTWKVPDSEFTQTERVTLRRLLSHTAGLTVHGFPGYAVTDRMPSVPEVLDGKGNTAPVRVDVVPGSIWRYSGGGYTVMQQLVTDVTGKSFPDYMREAVLQPFGMTSSTYEQPLPAALAAKTASGYYVDRSAVEGKWHVYPEMAAAGLWTTATDLAHFAIGIRQALEGKSKVLSAEMTRQMLTEQKGGYGLGFGVAGSDSTLQYSHGGRDEGFDAFLVAYAKSGDGVAIMINANDNSRMVRRIINYVARKYRWPGYPSAPEAAVPVQLAPAALAVVEGRYEYQNNNMMTLFAHNGRLYTDLNGLADEEFVPVARDQFRSTERDASFRAVKNATGEVDAIDWTQPNVARRIPRIGPLFPAASSAADPDPTFTRNLMTVLQQLAEGGQAVTGSTLLTAGARKDFGRPNPEMRDVRALTFVLAQDVAGRGIERHGHAVTRVVHYRVAAPHGPGLLLVHVDPSGLITDYDLVSR